MLKLILDAYFLSLTASLSLGIAFPDIAEQLFSYGKSLGKEESHDRSYGFVYRMITFRVPKRWFWHFYAVGTVFNAALIWCNASFWNILFETHLVRRLAESLFLEQHSSESKILLGHYIVGITFYIATSLSINLSTASEGVVAPLLCVVAQVCQFQCHQTLAALRAETALDSTYSLPCEGWFSQSSSPHYFFEVILYSALFLGCGCSETMFYCLLWVTSNLTITAKQTHAWYLQHFSSDASAVKVIRGRNVLVTSWSLVVAVIMLALYSWSGVALDKWMGSVRVNE